MIIGLTLFLGGILNTSFVHADGTGVTFIKDDTRRKGEEPETDVDEVGNIIVKVPAKDSVETKVIPIETEYLDDPTLAKGQEVEEAGEIGEITLTTIYTVDERDGTIEETISRQITKEIVKRRIRRGTREPEKVVVPEQSSIPSYPVSVTSNQGTVEPAKPVAPTTGWKQENAMWYFYNTDGSMATGWVQVNGSGYYLNSNGSMKANQWFQVGGKWYYVNASGELAVNTSIDGYRVNDNGEWVS